MSKIYDVIIRFAPKTEKTVKLGDQNTYVFEVKRSATKQQIRAAVEELLGQRVLSVNTMIRAGKKTRMGARQTKKRALVTIHPDDRIQKYSEYDTETESAVVAD